VAANEARIKLTAEDATAAAFGAVLKNVTNLKTELVGLPAKFTQIAIASAGIGSIAGFASMIQESIEAKAKLRDLSTQTNISVEALSSLSKVGKYSNTAIEDVASASTKLSKALFTQNEDSKGAAAAIAALGLNFDKFKNLAPDQQMLEVAKALDTFQDGSEKSAAAMLLFGKNGAQLLPFLKELSERGLEVAKVTAQQAEEAKKYEDNLVALKSAADEWKKTLSNDMLPALLEFSRELVAGRQAYGSWFDALIGIGTSNPLKDLGSNIRDTRDEVKSLEEELNKSKGGNLLEQALSRPAKVIEAELDSARKKYDYFKRLQAMQANDLASGIYEDPRLRTPKAKLVLPNASQNSDAADALLNKIFQGQIKQIKDFAQQQKDAYDFANKYLKGTYDDGVLALSEFFAEQKRLRDGSLQSELESIDKEIAAAKELMSKAAKPETRQAAENAIAAAKLRRARVVQQASQADVLATQEEEKAVKQLASTYYEFLANVASLRGDQAGAFELRVIKQIADAQELLTKIGFNPEQAKAEAQRFGDLLRQTDKLNRAQSDYNRLVDALAVTEKSITIDAQLAGSSELDTLRAIGAERQKQLPLLQALAEKAMAEAQAIGSPEALLAAQKLALTFRQAQLEADPVFTKIRDVGKEFGEALAGDAEQAILHWEGVRKLLLAIEQDILRIATRKLFTEPFGNYLANMIGGNGTAAGGGGLIGSGLDWLLGGGGAPSGGTGVWGGSSNYSALSQLPNFGADFFIPGLDGGTNYVPQDMLAMIHEGEAVVPKEYNDGGSTGAVNVTVNQSFSPGTDRRTIMQAAAAAGEQARRALGRNR
jgi:hypothetical protein